MTRPVCEYFVSSSHNTYLVGNQLVGASTCEGYIRVLLQGCRSVESESVLAAPIPTQAYSALTVDIWDGDKEPCIYHGRTLTKKVSVREVCRAIMKYAFVASPYPIVISTEIHCKVEQQDILAQIFKEEFGEALVTGPLPGREYEVEDGVRILPSPEELKGRILIKVRFERLGSTNPTQTSLLGRRSGTQFPRTLLWKTKMSTSMSNHPPPHLHPRPRLNSALIPPLVVRSTLINSIRPR